MNALRRLAVSVEEPLPGAFHWVLLECEDDPSIWREVAAASAPLPTFERAFEAGSAALMALRARPHVGPRRSGEDEGADPVG